MAVESNRPKEKENPKITFRRMEKEDIPGVFRLGKAAPGTAVSEQSSFWEKEQLKNWLNQSNDPMIIAEDRGKIVGFCLARIHHPTKNAILENLLVSPEYRRKGVGNQLLERCLKELRTQGVTYIYGLAHIEDESSIEFLIKRGFTMGFNFTWLEMDLMK